MRGIRNTTEAPDTGYCYSGSTASDWRCWRRRRRRRKHTGTEPSLQVSLDVGKLDRTTGRSGGNSSLATLSNVAKVRAIVKHCPKLSLCIKITQQG